MIKQTIEELHTQLHKQFKPFLNSPATEAAIQSAEKEMNVTFPEQLRALYLAHDGEQEASPGLFFGLPFLSLEEMVSEWQAWKDLDEDEELNEIDAFSVPQFHIKERYANRQWIPISTDFGGNHIGVDLDPDVEGTIGQIINFGRDEEVKYVMAHQIGDLLSFIVETLKNDEFIVSEEEDYISWSYGKTEDLHFLDVIRTLELPMLAPNPSPISDEGITQWFGSLDENWRSIIQELADSPKEFTTQKTLRFIEDHITDITPLTMCMDVRDLLLSGAKISELTPIGKLVSLKKLYLVDLAVQNINALENLTNLQQLKISRMNVTNIESLKMLPSLKKVEIIDTPIVDYAPLVQINNLESLEIAITNQQQLEAITSIQSLQQLHITDIANVDLKQFNNLKNLRKLTIEKANFKSLDFLKENQNLQELLLVDCRITGGAMIAKLGQLHNLELDGTTINDFETIAASTSLKTFTGSFQQFNQLKNAFPQQVDCSKIIGGMTDGEREIWRNHLRNN